MGWDVLIVVGVVAVIVAAVVSIARRRKHKARGGDNGEASLGGTSHRNIDHDAGSDGGGGD